MSDLILVIGGARSGKSSFAARAAKARSASPVPTSPRLGCRTTTSPSGWRVIAPSAGPSGRRSKSRETWLGRIGPAAWSSSTTSTLHWLTNLCGDAGWDFDKGPGRRAGRARAGRRHRRHLDLRVQRARDGAARGARGDAQFRGRSGLPEPGHRATSQSRGADGGGPPGRGEGGGGVSAPILQPEEIARFSDEARRAVYDVIELRRDVRHFVEGAAVDDATLERILHAAHRAPSVGFSQPWGFIVVRDVERRKRVRESFLACRDAEAARYPAERREQYLAHRLEGILDAPVNVCVAVDLRPQAEAILGTTAQPEAVRASVCCSVQNLWLAARAEGLGVGWVSIVEPQVLRTTKLSLPPRESSPSPICASTAIPSRFARSRCSRRSAGDRGGPWPARPSTRDRWTSTPTSTADRDLDDRDPDPDRDRDRDPDPRPGRPLRRPFPPAPPHEASAQPRPPRRHRHLVRRRARHLPCPSSGSRDPRPLPRGPRRRRRRGQRLQLLGHGRDGVQRDVRRRGRQRPGQGTPRRPRRGRRRHRGRPERRASLARRPAHARPCPRGHPQSPGRAGHDPRRGARGDGRGTRRRSRCRRQKGAHARRRGRDRHRQYDGRRGPRERLHGRRPRG